MYITNVNSCVITVLSLESVSISGDGRIFQTYGDSGVEYSYDFYLKDHLGSTRMVINSQDQITEAVAYQAYGAMDPLDSIANAPEIPAREKFTGKEFDQEGEDSANGVAGIQCYHFGARVYDPEVGVWLSVDPAEQDFFVYGYCNGNPIILVDPNGEYWIGAIIGAVIGAYAGGAMANGSFNPGDWDWHDVGTWTGMIGGAFRGASLGSGIENSVLRSHFGNLTNMPKTRYGLNAYVSARGGMLQIRNDIITKAYNLGGQEPMQNTIDFLTEHEGIAGNFYYKESPPARVPSARGNTPNSEGSFIYKNAFKLNGKFEPSSVIQTMSHESFMQLNFLEMPKDFIGQNINRRFMEIGAYEQDVFNARKYGFSKLVEDYANRKLLEWLNFPLPF